MYLNEYEVDCPLKYGLVIVRNLCCRVKLWPSFFTLQCSSSLSHEYLAVVIICVHCALITAWLKASQRSQDGV